MARVTPVAVAVAAVLAAVGGLLVSTPSPAVGAVDTAATYQLVARHSGLALDVSGASTADGAAVVQWSRSGATNQRFRFTATSGGFYRITAVHSGKALDVSGASSADGAAVVQWPVNGGANQEWSLTDVGGGYVRVTSRLSGKALDVAGAATAPGATVQQWTSHGNTNQQWQLVRADSGGGAPAPAPSPVPAPSGPSAPPAAYPGPGVVTGSTGVHDPTVVKTAAGGYLMVSTGINLSIKTSTDRTAWRDAGAVWPNGAPWTTTYTNGDRNLWAPDISFRNGLYYLYYSASSFGSQRSAIFLATSRTGASGSWTDQGLVVQSSASVDYNAIDPNLVVDAAGRWWLAFGSFWSGIKQVRLDPATGKRSTSDTAVRALAGRPASGGAVEAPFVMQRGGYYYLFASFDTCCQGARSTYRTMVGRSSSVNGPFVDRNGTPMTSGGGTQLLAGHGSIHGPGHPTVLSDTDGDVLVYHYYADNGAALLGINLLGWDSAGWPFVY